MNSNRIIVQQHDALIIVDVQYDFLPGGSLAVPEGHLVIPELNRYIRLFEEHKLPVFATRDWHPADHCSFVITGGSWPMHCVAGTQGAQISNDLLLPDDTVIFSKATDPDREAYSGLDGTHLEKTLSDLGITRTWVGGLATDYCVLETVKDLRTAGFNVLLLLDAIRAVNVNPGDEEAAVKTMIESGALPIRYKDIV